MLRFVTVFTAAVALTWSAPSPVNIFEIDISPEEAQRYLSSPPFTAPQLSGRSAVLPLVRWNDPRFRTAEAGPTLGHYWRNGQEIENTDDYLEEVYEASQFHGQDGLGAYAYGYKTPESSKIENRVGSGDVTGSYTYKTGNDQEIQVRYWADSQGFHQEDNLPKVELKPAEETQEVRQARLAHEKAWNEAAAAAALQPDPQGAYNANEYQSAASEPQGQYASAPGQGPREGKAYNTAQSYQSGPQSGQQQFAQGQFNQQRPIQVGQQQFGQQSVSAQGQYGQQVQGQEEPEPTGPPRGFFYAFDYPVSIIVAKNAGQGGPVNPGQVVDHDTVSVAARAPNARR